VVRESVTQNATATSVRDTQCPAVGTAAAAGGTCPSHGTASAARRGCAADAARSLTDTRPWRRRATVSAAAVGGGGGHGGGRPSKVRLRPPWQGGHAGETGRQREGASRYRQRPPGRVSTATSRQPGDRGGVLTGWRRHETRRARGRRDREIIASADRELVGSMRTHTADGVVSQTPTVGRQ